MVLVAATLWGLSGTASQYLMQHDGIGPGWLVCLRLAVAGPTLLLVCWRRSGSAALWAPLRNGGDRIRLVLFASFGLFAVQFTYLAAIDAANAATATFLQYLGSALAVGWLALTAWRLPSGRQAIALLVALAGIGLVTTDGSLHALAVPPMGVVWGLLAAVTLVMNTLLPAPLLRRHATTAVVGWGMATGAVTALAVLRPPLWPHAARLDASMLALLAFVVVLGTIVPFALYMRGVRTLPASEAMLFANGEPVAAALAAVLLLRVPLGPWAMAGGALVLSATTDLYRHPSAPDAVPAPDAGLAPGSSQGL